MNTQNKTPMSKTLITSAVASAIGSLLFGFDTAVIAGTTSSLKEVFSLTDGQLGFTVLSGSRDLGLYQ